MIQFTKVRDITNLKQKITDEPLPPLMKVCYSKHGKKSSTVLLRFVQLMVPIQKCIKRGKKKNLNIYISFNFNTFSFIKNLLFKKKHYEINYYK